MTSLEDHYEFRSQLVRDLEQDLLGPSAEDELLDESPLDHYVTGIMFPAGRAENVEESDDPEDAQGQSADAPFDPGVALAQMKHPSSFGLSFGIDPTVNPTVTARITAAWYEPEVPPAGTIAPPADIDTHVALDPVTRARRARGDTRWRRSPVGPVEIDLDAQEATVREREIAPGLVLYVVVRSQVDGVVPVTVILRNTRLVPAGEMRDGYCWFQPQLTVTTNRPAIVARSTRRVAAITDEDLDSYDLLFRDARSFAGGHGCAVTWAPTSELCTDLVQTTFLPQFELPVATPRAASARCDLRMSSLSTSDGPGIANNLRGLVEDYQEWIDRKRALVPDLTSDLQATATRHLDTAQVAAGRIQAGIDLLVADPQAREAFRLMNAGMLEQRRRQDWIREGAQGNQPPDSDQAWRPFQLAFILLNICGLAVPGHDDRDVADLLWFPTGGGKTEAYLGLVGFVALLRRIQRKDERGVAVIMRYTLRLLTLQQFERAATLMCALEQIRREAVTPVEGVMHSLSDTEPISLGLWVGQGATPNKRSDAARGLRRLASGQEPEKGNPVQLTRCPWCGSPLDVSHYRIPRGNSSPMVVACGRGECAFGDGLPVYLVDEDVYEIRPSLLIGTVDKFAQMAWQEATRTIFSTDGNGYGPDLVIQDELHLISGPLGTLVGLYETAVDAAASTSSGRPKFVASTATIRRATQQIRAVFDRESFQFPPPGLEPTDSFFAVEAPREEKGTRQYVGLLAPGTSPATLLVRTYAALLQSALDTGATDAVRDPYWTLVGYFNSLRVLGGAYMQVIDDVPDRLRLLAKRRETTPREVVSPLELTSRIDSSRVPQALEQLGESLPSSNSPSVVLATNMISVGVDVDRLGLMVVMGQPQATAEYIQATSRVGRKHPGLVVVMYNSARSRDRSHYENFLQYHQSLYREVEATGATPFAARARDRGLHGVLVAMARLLISGAATNDAAGQVSSFEAALRAQAAAIAQRADRVEPREARDTARQLDELVDVWMTEAAARGGLKYSVWNDPQTSLLVDAGRALTDPTLNLDTSDTPWPTLTSLRDVDAESSLYMIPNYDWKGRT